MDVRERLAAAKKRQDAARREKAIDQKRVKPAIDPRGMKAFADGLDRVTGDPEGSTWGRFQTRHANREPQSSASKWASSHVGSGCSACGGYGYANVLVADMGGKQQQALQHCQECGYWEEAIERGVAQYLSDKEYRRRVEARARDNFVAEVIVARGKSKMGGGPRRSAASYGDLG